MEDMQSAYSLEKPLLALERLRSGQPDDFWANYIQKEYLEKIDEYIDKQIEHQLSFVKLVVGEYGTGKTFLLRHLESFCQERGLPYGILNVQVKRGGSLGATMSHLLVHLLEQLVSLQETEWRESFANIAEKAKDVRVRSILLGITKSPRKRDIPSAVEQLFIGGRVTPLREALGDFYSVASGTSPNSIMDFLLGITEACGTVGKPAFLFIDEAEALEAGGHLYKMQMLDALRHLVDHQSKYGGLFLFGTDAFVSLLQNYAALQDRLFSKHFSRKSPYWETNKLYEQSHKVFLDRLFSLYEETLTEEKEKERLQMIRERMQQELQQGELPKTSHREFLRHSLGIIDAAIEESEDLETLLKGYVVYPIPDLMEEKTEEEIFASLLGNEPTRFLTEKIGLPAEESKRQSETLAVVCVDPCTKPESLAEHGWQTAQQIRESFDKKLEDSLEDFLGRRTSFDPFPEEEDYPEIDPNADFPEHETIEKLDHPDSAGKAAETSEIFSTKPDSFSEPKEEIKEQPEKGKKEEKEDDGIMVLPEEYLGIWLPGSEKELESSSSLSVLVRRIGKGLDAGEIAPNFVFQFVKVQTNVPSNTKRIVAYLGRRKTFSGRLQISEIIVDLGRMQGAIWKAEEKIRKVTGKDKIDGKTFWELCIKEYRNFQHRTEKRNFNLYGWIRANVIFWEIIFLHHANPESLYERNIDPDYWRKNILQLLPILEKYAEQEWKIMHARRGAMEAVQKNSLFFGNSYRLLPLSIVEK